MHTPTHLCHRRLCTTLLAAAAAVTVVSLAVAGILEYKSGVVWPRPKVVDPGPAGGPPADADRALRRQGPVALDRRREVDRQGRLRHRHRTTSAPSRSSAIASCTWNGPTPEKVDGNGQGRGNSGVFLMDRYEIQVLDSYDNETYYDGQAGSVYKQHPPLVNVCRKPGQWQTYDIIWEGPRFDKAGKLLRPAYVTLLHNGVLVQNHFELTGDTSYDPAAAVCGPSGPRRDRLAVSRQPGPLPQYLDSRDSAHGAAQGQALSSTVPVGTPPPAKGNLPPAKATRPRPAEQAEPGGLRRAVSDSGKLSVEGKIPGSVPAVPVPASPPAAVEEDDRPPPGSHRRAAATAATQYGIVIFIPATTGRGARRTGAAAIMGRTSVAGYGKNWSFAGFFLTPSFSGPLQSCGAMSIVSANRHAGVWGKNPMRCRRMCGAVSDRARANVLSARHRATHLPSRPAMPGN